VVRTSIESEEESGGSAIAVIVGALAANARSSKRQYGFGLEIGLILFPIWLSVIQRQRNFLTYYRESSRVIAAAFSAIIAVGVLVLPEVMVGITEASATRNPASP
jgi:hypothetical protein